MIAIEHATVLFPQPKRIREIIAHPFRKKASRLGLHEVTLCIEPGDRVAILGENGAGKTTLLRLIGGMVLPVKGHVSVYGYDTSASNLKARERIGYVLNEERSFYWRLTAAENMEFFGALDNLHGTFLYQRIDELMDAVGLTEARDRKVAEFSSGMRQRLALARGFLSDPDILILDEPTKSLDFSGAHHIWDILVRRMHLNKNLIVIISTHNFQEIEKLCNKIVYIHHGKVLGIVDNHELVMNSTTIHEWITVMISNAAQEETRPVNYAYSAESRIMDSSHKNRHLVNEIIGK